MLKIIFTIYISFGFSLTAQAAVTNLYKKPPEKQSDFQTNWKEPAKQHKNILHTLKEDCKNRLKATQNQWEKSRIIQDCRNRSEHIKQTGRDLTDN